MKLEKAIRRLEIKNDIEVLTVDELKEKYAKDADRAKYFLHLYNGITLDGSNNHSKVRELLTFIKDERVNGTEFEKEAEWLIGYNNMEAGLTEKYIYRKEKDYQSYDLRLQNLGITDVYGFIKYPELVNMLYENTKKIDAYYKANPNFPNFGDFRYMLFKAYDEAKGGALGETKTVKDYYEKFPLLNLCHDEQFVITFNSLLRNPNVDDKNDLISLYYNVVDFSLTYDPIDKDFDEKNYRRAVRVANRKLNEYQKTHKESKVYKR